MRPNPALSALAVALLLNLSACGGGGGGSSGSLRATPHVTPWRNNPAAQDLLDHWHRPETLRREMGLAAVDPMDLPARRGALEAIVRMAEDDPVRSGTRLRNVRGVDVEIIGERDGITYGRWTGGPAGCTSDL